MQPIGRLAPDEQEVDGHPGEDDSQTDEELTGFGEEWQHEEEDGCDDEEDRHDHRHLKSDC